MCENGNESVTMNARVLRVCCDSLLVCDRCNNQEALVHTDDACRFRAGQNVCIRYNGAMTMSIPPQISAESVCPGCCR